MAVNLCARSAHTLPTLTTASNRVSCPRFAAAAAARNRAIFCCGVSPVGAGAPKVICDPGDADVVAFGELEPKPELLAA